VPLFFSHKIAHFQIQPDTIFFFFSRTINIDFVLACVTASRYYASVSIAEG